MEQAIEKELVGIGREVAFETRKVTRQAVSHLDQLTHIPRRPKPCRLLEIKLHDKQRKSHTEHEGAKQTRAKFTIFQLRIKSNDQAACNHSQERERDAALNDIEPGAGVIDKRSREHHAYNRRGKIDTENL